MLRFCGAAGLPTGTVTFMFTDIEGSTRLLRELGAERYGAELELASRADPCRDRGS
jgi:class 3 adenylate cyclase